MGISSVTSKEHSKPQDEVYDRKENVHLGTRNTSQREIGARFDLVKFTLRMLRVVIV